MARALRLQIPGGQAKAAVVAEAAAEDAPPAAGPRLASDRDLVARYRSGDRGAAEALAERSYTLVFRSLLRMCGGDRDLAADLTQETYRRAWAGLAGFDGRAAFSSWLYRIAYNAFLNHVRRPRLAVPIDDLPAGALRSGEPAADRQLVERETRERVRRAVLALDEDARLPLTGRYWGGLATAELARLCGVSEVTVRKRIARALTRLAATLGGTR